MSNYLNDTDNAVIIPEIVANQMIGALGAFLNLGKTVSKDSDLTPVKFGKTISIPKRGAVVANQKTAGNDTTLQSPAATETLVNIDQHWEVTLGEEDYTNAVQQVGTLPGYQEDSVIALAEKIEGALAAHILEFDNVDAGTNAGDAQKGIIDVRKRLNDNKVPLMRRRYGYIATSFAAQLLKEEAFIDPKIIPSNQALTEGSIGRVSGFDLFEGQLAPSTGSPAKFQNFFYTSLALVLASRPPRDVPAGYGAQSSSLMSDAGIALRVINYFDPKGLAMAFTVDTIFGTGINDDRQGFVLESE